MKKIVILSDNAGASNTWVEMLNVFFPECKIEIRPVLPNVEKLQSHPFSTFAKASIKNDPGG